MLMFFIRNHLMCFLISAPQDGMFNMGWASYLERYQTLVYTIVR